jgi:hypothetical protein
MRTVRRLAAAASSGLGSVTPLVCGAVDLLEHAGKRVLAAHGVHVPIGHLALDVDPCDGRIFPADGAGLVRFPTTVNDDGKVVVDLSNPSP